MASWTRWRGEDCLRLAGVGVEAEVRVRPSVRALRHDLPPMAGRVEHDGEDACFVPRFAFVGGTTYEVFVDGVATAALDRPATSGPPTTDVVDIRPTAEVVPRNLLRLYVHFSAPMRDEGAADHVRLVDEAGRPLAAALLATEYDLWDATRQRLTILLDPARLKRGLVAHRRIGYPLREGETFRLVVDETIRDAAGRPLRHAAERRYRVGPDERTRVQPERWTLPVPPRRSLDPLEVTFDRPLDHGLLGRALRVVGPDGRTLDGRAQIGDHERSWRWLPADAWTAGPHGLVVDPVLEDLAGNSVRRVFDRDLTRVEDDPGAAAPVQLAFRPS